MTLAITMSIAQYMRNECSHKGQTFKLTKQQAIVVALLIFKGGRFASMAEFIDAIWPNPDSEPEWASRVVYIQLAFIRKKMPGCITTLPTRGYLLERLSNDAG